MNTINSLDDLRIGVVNPGPVEPTWFYDGKAYVYVVRSATNKDAITVVPWNVAQHHWGLGIKEDNDGKMKVVRKDWKETQDRDSLLESRLASICPKKWYKPNPDLPGHYIDDPVVKEWFLNKVSFKTRAMKQVTTEAEFLA